MISTGLNEEQRAEAETLLAEYVSKSKLQTSKTYFVYFVTAKSDGFPIKIGISTSRFLRFVQLQNAMPYEIEVMAMMPTDDPLLERRLHRQFGHLRLRGEWFARGPELVAYIRTLCESGTAA